MTTVFIIFLFKLYKAFIESSSKFYSTEESISSKVYVSFNIAVSVLLYGCKVSAL